jgi:hypothetical protein
MNLEGKVCSYNKRTLATIVLVVFVAGVMFYAGAKYEKRKLSSLGLLKSSSENKSKKKKPEKNNATKGEFAKENSTTPSDRQITNESPIAPEEETATPINTPEANLQK